MTQNAVVRTADKAILMNDGDRPASELIAMIAGTATTRPPPLMVAPNTAIGARIRKAPRMSGFGNDLISSDARLAKQTIAPSPIRMAARITGNTAGPSLRAVPKPYCKDSARKAMPNAMNRRPDASSVLFLTKGLLLACNQVPKVSTTFPNLREFSMA